MKVLSQAHLLMLCFMAVAPCTVSYLSLLSEVAGRLGGSG